MGLNNIQVDSIENVETNNYSSILNNLYQREFKTTELKVSINNSIILSTKLAGHHKEIADVLYNFINELLGNEYIDTTDFIPLNLLGLKKIDVDYFDLETMEEKYLYSFFQLLMAQEDGYGYITNKENAKEITEIITKHIERIKDKKAENIIDIYRIFDPIKSEIKREHYDSFAIMQVSHFNKKKIIENAITNPDYARLINKLTNIFFQDPDTLKDDKTLVKDWMHKPLKREYRIADWKLKFLKLPLNTKKYRNFIETVEVKHLHKIIEKISSGVAAGAAISISKEIIETKEYSKDEKILIANEAFQNIFKKIYKKINPSSISALYTNFINSMDKVATHKTLKEYFEGEEEFNSKLLDSVVGLHFNEREKSWVRNYEHADYIISRLRDFLTPKEIIQTISEVSSNGIPLTLTQWETFINEIDTYRNVPAEWWVRIIANSNKNDS